MQTEAEHSGLDRVVRDKLNALRPAYRPESWERMASRLDAEANAAFDEAVADQLGKVTVPYQATSWDALAARLDADDAPTAFDDAISDGLTHVRVPDRSGSWEALAARLELERQRMRAVVHYKAMELSLLLLLFLTAWQHLDFASSPVMPAIAPSVSYPIADLTQPDESATIANAQESASQITGVRSISSNLVGVSPLDLPVQEVRSQGVSRPLTFAQSAAIKQRAQAADVVPLPTPRPDLLEYPTGPQERLAALRAEKAAAVAIPADRTIVEGAMTALHTGAPALLDYGEPEELLRYIRPVERKNFVRIGFFGSPDYNYVITPPQRIEDGSIYTSSRYTLGYSGGVSIGVEHNERWEIETGFVYAARRYQAIPTVFVTGSIKDGFSGYSLQDFELNTFSAPLNFRYNFLVHDKWRIYSQLGAALNVVTQANYYAVDEGAFTSLQSAGGGNAESGISRVSKPDILKRKSFNEGWLDGGTFWENATLYGDLGVGVERYMTADWGVFVQPHYQRALPFFNDGLGPYEDKIHNFAIRLGLKVRL